MGEEELMDDLMEGQVTEELESSDALLNLRIRRIGNVYEHKLRH